MVKQKHEISLAIFFALCASLFMALMSVFVKLIGTHQTTVTIVFARFLLGLIFLFPWFLTDKKLLQTPHKAKIFLRSITSLLAIGCMFYALKFMPVVNVLLLNNTFPLFVPIIVTLFLHLKTSWKVWLSILIGFIGVTLVLQPHTSTFNLASIVALLAGLLVALSMIQIRFLSLKVTSLQILFYLFLFSTIITGIILPFSFHKPDSHDLWLLILVGISGTFYQLFLTLSLKYAIARIVSPIFFSAIVFSVIFDWFFWGEIPNLLAVIGAVLIIAAGIATVIFSDKRH